MAILSFKRVTVAMAVTASASLLAACENAATSLDRSAGKAVAEMVAEVAPVVARGWQPAEGPGAAASGAGHRQPAGSVHATGPSDALRARGFEVSELPPVASQADDLARRPVLAATAVEIETADITVAAPGE